MTPTGATPRGWDGREVEALLQFCLLWSFLLVNQHSTLFTKFVPKDMFRIFFQLKN